VKRHWTAAVPRGPTSGLTFVPTVCVLCRGTLNPDLSIILSPEELGMVRSGDRYLKLKRSACLAKVAADFPIGHDAPMKAHWTRAHGLSTTN
jgi:hypothetical protein